MDIPSVQISVIVPIFNGALYINEAIKSLLSQEIDNLEILIIDDNLFNCTSLMISFRSLNLKTDMVYIFV